MDKKKLLEEDTAVEILTASKQTARQINEKQQIAKETETAIEETRFKYIDLSSKLSKLFFAVNDISNISRMYEYSLESFMELIVNSQTNSKQSYDIRTRTSHIYDYFIELLFRVINRSIFSQHIFVFAFLVIKRLDELNEQPQIDPKLFHFLLNGLLVTPSNITRAPVNCWISEQ